MLDTINIVLPPSASQRLWLPHLFFMMAWNMHIGTTFTGSLKVAQSHFSAQRGADPKPVSEWMLKVYKCGNCSLNVAVGT